MITSFLFLSCSNEVNIVQNASDDVRGQKFGPEMILGEKLNNPYSLSNMQVAYESLVRTKYGEDEEVEQLFFVLFDG